MSQTPEILHQDAKAANTSKVWIVAITGGILVCLGIFAIFYSAKSAEDRTLPGLFVGDIFIGDMTKTELKDFLDSMSNKLSTDGIEVNLKHVSGTHSFTLLPQVIGDADVADYIRIDTTKETDRIFELGKGDNALSNTWAYVQSKVTDQSITLKNIVVDRERIENAIRAQAAKYEQPPQNSKLVFKDFEPLRYSITSSTSGFVYPIDKSIDAIEQAAKNLERPSVTLASESSNPTVTESEWSPVLGSLSTAFAAGPLVLSYVDEAGDVQKEWKIPVSTFANWLTLREENRQNHLTLDTVSTTEYLVNRIDSAVRQDPEDAKFRVDAVGKVQEFKASRVGIGLDTQKTYEALQASFDLRLNGNTSTPVQIVLTEVEPNVATGQVNDLGIEEVLGVGISNFAGSPSNRVKNIRNAVVKLNGLLIKPGDEFSAIKYTQPYTIEGGYLPEKVIKGDELKAEIGGGLCQVGTTLFRMAMNSGMEITERRNHSLVVSYYNDLSNGLPGTDATIYDPAPDFRFKNDTNNYILLQTAMNESTGELKFTLWGTSDGRKASYSKPVVHKWIPAGPARITETTSLAPGQKQCQSAFRGAQTSFTYTRVMPDGTKQETLFDSYYRPLPQICLVGVAQASTPNEDEALLDSEEQIIAPVNSATSST